MFLASTERPAKRVHGAKVVEGVHVLPRSLPSNPLFLLRCPIARIMHKNAVYLIGTSRYGVCVSAGVRRGGILGTHLRWCRSVLNHLASNELMEKDAIRV